MEGDPAMRPSVGFLPSQSFQWINNFIRPPPPWGKLSFVIVTGEQAFIDWTESSGCGTISPEREEQEAGTTGFIYLFIYFYLFIYSLLDADTL